MLLALELLVIVLSIGLATRTLVRHTRRSKLGDEEPTRPTSRLWKGAAVFVCAATLAASLINLEFRLFKPVSVEAAGLLFLSTLLPIALALFALAFPIFAGALPQLPSSTPAVNIHRRKVSIWFCAMAALVAIAIVTYWVGPAAWREDVFIWGCVSVLCGSLLLASVYLKAKWMDYGRTAVTLRPWLRWQYSKSEWEQWLEEPATEIPETTFGREGYLSGDVYRPWVTLGWYLSCAKAVADTQLQIQFTFVDSSYGVGSEQGKLILVPQGREDDLASLQRELRKRLPSAAIELIPEPQSRGDYETIDNRRAAGFTERQPH